MKEIVVISGKGGTGKTSVTASFAVLGQTDVVIADCDVDAPDMHLLLQPDYGYAEDFYSGELAGIDQSTCIRCGECKNVCRFDAVQVLNGRYLIDKLSCEGCGYCARICPAHAITNQERLAGEWFISGIRTGSTMVHARLGIGSGNSGKLVAKVKNEAREIALEERKQYVLVDGSPGVGCPVVSSVSGASFVVLVTEPSVSGLHDLKRVHELVKKFNIKAGCIVNKADINPEITAEIVQYLDNEGVAHIVDLPYDEEFVNSIRKAQTIAESDNVLLKALLTEAWERIKQLVNN